MRIVKVNLNKQNRMLRIGFGLNNGVLFGHIDLWFFSLRIMNREIKNLS